jgi:LPXTG-site transpeptidase (sortase) family protein
MYSRQRGGSGISLYVIVMLGVLGGIGFLVYDTVIRSDPPAAAVSDNTFSPLTLDTAVEGTPPTGSESQPIAAAEGETQTVNSPGSRIPGRNYFGQSELFIPAAGISAPIVQVYLDGTSWDVTSLGMAVGHLQGTTWLDDGPGNIVLSGHVELADGRRGIFSRLDDLAVGDEIYVTRDGVDRVYRIIEINSVDPDDLTPLYPTTTPRLTLITCSSYDFWSDTYEQRHVIVAELITNAT